MWSWYDRNRTRVFGTERQCFECCSINYAFDGRCVGYLLQICVVNCLLSLHVLSIRVHPQTIKFFLPPFYLWWCSHEVKYLESGNLGAWEWDYNTLLQASAHLHTTTHSHLYGLVTIIPRLPASEHKQCNREDGERNFTHIRAIKGRKGLKGVNCIPWG